MTKLTPLERFLRACRGKMVDYTPVWFMRQAGRYLSGYREIRKKHSILEICRTPELCKQVTLMPLNELGVDAAVMFADIMLPLEGLGIDFAIEENQGPIINKPIRGIEEVEKLEAFDSRRDVPFLLDAISQTKASIPDTALIGFSGAPFTLASYIIEGQATRDFAKTKRLMYEDRIAWDLLLSKLSLMISEYLLSQIRAGVDAVQLFDSWIGALSGSDYVEYVQPHVKEIFSRLRNESPNTPSIHFGTNTHHLLSEMKSAGGDVFSIDWRFKISEARRILGEETAVQGNLDPVVLLSGDKDFIAQRVGRVLKENEQRPGHIFNLGHGILRETPVENAKFVVEYVHNNS